MKKKNRQNAREDSLWQEYKTIEAILDKIKSTGSGPVDLTDPYARKCCKTSSQRLQKAAGRRQAMNAHYRKHKTMKGYPGMRRDIAAHKDASHRQRPSLAQSPCRTSSWPAFAARSSEYRPAWMDWTLQARQDAPEAAEEHDGFRIVRNAEQNRLQSSSLTASPTRPPARPEAKRLPLVSPATAPGCASSPTTPSAPPAAPWA